MIYLDNSATTKPDPTVIESFKKAAATYYANPSSIHELGGEVERLQQRARQQAAALLHIKQEEVVFTSGGTESNNLAIKGIALQHRHRGNHIITTQIEHASVYETCQSLEKLGFIVTYLPVNEAGVVQVADLEAAITDETILISIMQVNNEIGTQQPISEIGAIAKRYPKLFFHVDAVQALGKVPVSLTNSGIDLCSFSGHKIHGLKGTGMLYVKEGTAISPLFHGGGQENNLRSGTENVPGNVAFVRALRLILARQEVDSEHLRKLHRKLMEACKYMDGVELNSSHRAAPHIVHISVPGLKPEVVIHALYKQGIAISTQSACSSKQFEESRVLRAIGKNKANASAGLRISLQFDTTEAEIDTFIQVFTATIRNLKEVLE